MKNVKRLIAGLVFSIMFVSCIIPVSARAAIVRPEPLVDMQKITVRPYYLDDKGKQQVLSGYEYNRTGNITQAISCKVTKVQQEKMRQMVEEAGKQLAGYQITVQFVNTGNFKNGVVITEEPSGMAAMAVSSGMAQSVVFYSSADCTEFHWDAYFRYSYTNKLLTQAMDAWVDFEQ